MDATPFPSLSLIFPCYRAGAFLVDNLDQVAVSFQELRVAFEIIVVDDGSRDDTQKCLSRAAPARPWLRVAVHPENRGKGAAVRTGLAQARGQFAIMNDIDLQYRVSDMYQCYDRLRRGLADVVIGSRVHAGSCYHIRATQLRYIFTRHVLSRALNFLIRNTLLPGIHDTQCGLKGFSRRFMRAVRATPLLINGFAFDIELLVMAREQGFTIQEIPVQFHYADIASTVRFLRAGARMVRDVLRIAAHRQAGNYARKIPKKRWLPELAAATVAHEEGWDDEPPSRLQIEPGG